MFPSHFRRTFELLAARFEVFRCDLMDTDVICRIPTEPCLHELYTRLSVGPGTVVIVTNPLGYIKLPIIAFPESFIKDNRDPPNPVLSRGSSADRDDIKVIIRRDRRIRTDGKSVFKNKSRGGSRSKGADGAHDWLRDESVFKLSTNTVYIADNIYPAVPAVQ